MSELPLAIWAMVVGALSLGADERVVAGVIPGRPGPSMFRSARWATSAGIPRVLPSPLGSAHDRPA